jgi:hypothetical protein
MNHYENVTTVLDAIQDYPVGKAKVEKLIQEADEYEDVEMLAEDVMYIMISFWGGTTPEFKKEFVERLTGETIDYEIHELFWQEDASDLEEDLSEEDFDG